MLIGSVANVPMNSILDELEDSLLELVDELELLVLELLDETELDELVLDELEEELELVLELLLEPDSTSGGNPAVMKTVLC